MLDSVLSSVTIEVTLSVDEVMIGDVLEVLVRSMISEAIEVVLPEEILPKSPVEVPRNAVLDATSNELVVTLIVVKIKLVLLEKVVDAEDMSVSLNLEIGIVALLDILVVKVRKPELVLSAVMLNIGVVTASCALEVVF